MTSSVERQLNSYIHQLNEAQKEALLEFLKTMLPDLKSLSQIVRDEKSK